MAQKEPRKHHYVPQFLLRNFSDPEERVYVFDKHKSTTRRQSPREVAFEKDLYVFKDKTPDRRNLENLATLFDDFGSEPLRKLLKFEGLSSISPEELVKLSYFVAAMMIRVPHTRISALAFNKHMIEQWGPDICAEGSDVPISAFNEGTARDMTIDMTATATPEFAELLQGKVWFLMKSTAEHPFYISDNPVAKHNLIERPFRGNLGLKNEGIEIYLPLSPRLTLMLLCPKMTEVASRNRETGLHDAYYTDTPISAGPENVEHLNSLQVVNAERFIFSTSSDFSLAQDMVREHPELSKGSGMRTHQ